MQLKINVLSITNQYGHPNNDTTKKTIMTKKSSVDLTSGYTTI